MNLLLFIWLTKVIISLFFYVHPVLNSLYCVFSLIMPSSVFGGNTEIEYCAVYPGVTNPDHYSPSDLDSSFERQDHAEAQQRHVAESHLKSYR